MTPRRSAIHSASTIISAGKVEHPKARILPCVDEIGQCRQRLLQRARWGRAGGPGTGRSTPCRAGGGCPRTPSSGGGGCCPTSSAGARGDSAPPSTGKCPLVARITSSRRLPARALPVMTSLSPAEYDIGRVDEVDAVVEGAADDANRVVMVGVAAPAEHHVAEAERRHHHPRAAEGAVVHRATLGSPHGSQGTRAAGRRPHLREGPRWHDGRLYLSDFFDHAVKAVSLDGTVETVVEVPNQPSGLGWLPDGRMLVVSMLDRKLLRQERRGASSSTPTSPGSPRSTATTWSSTPRGAPTWATSASTSTRFLADERG